MGAWIKRGVSCELCRSQKTTMAPTLHSSLLFSSFLSSSMFHVLLQSICRPHPSILLVELN